MVTAGAGVLRVPAQSRMLVGPCPVPVRPFEAAPWVLGLTVAKASSRLRWGAPTAGDPSARPKPTNTGRSPPKRGAQTLMGGGGAERLASDTKPRRLAGGAGEAAAADRARSGRSWGAELGGGGAELAGSAEPLLGAAEAGRGASHFWRNRRSFQKGWRVGGHGASPKCRCEWRGGTTVAKRVKLPRGHGEAGGGVTKLARSPKLSRGMPGPNGRGHTFGANREAGVNRARPMIKASSIGAHR